MFRILWIGAVLAVAAAGQTQVDLRTQSKAADFSSFSLTKPFSTGGSLPATCAVGQMFFLSSGVAGQNLYGCTAANTWTLQAGGGGGGSGSGVAIESAGTPVGTSSTLSFSGGAGILYSISSIGSAISIQSASNTAVTPTLVSEQTGGVRFCVSASGSATAYSCAMSPTLTAYTAGMILDWKPDVTAAGGAVTLNVDFLGATPVTLSDGLTAPAAGDVVAGRMQQVWYDGASFRLLNEVVPAGVLGDALPTCASVARGRLWFVAGASGVKDTLQVCAKDATNTYAWRTLY